MRPPDTNRTHTRCSARCPPSAVETSCATSPALLQEKIIVRQSPWTGVDWVLPPTSPLDLRRQLLATGTCRPSPAPTTNARPPRPPPAIPISLSTSVGGSVNDEFFSFKCTYEPYHSPGCLGRRPHAHVHRPRVTALAPYGLAVSRRTKENEDLVLRRRS